MKSFFSMFRWQELKSQLSEVIRRFPLPLIISTLVTLLFFILIHGDIGNETEKLIGKLIMTGVVTFFLATWLSLFGESVKKRDNISYFWQIWALVFGWVFYYFLSNDFESFETIVFFMLTLFGIVSFLFIAPYTRHLKLLEHKPESYYVYFYRIAVVFFISCIVGGALALLWNIAIAAVRTLFDISYWFMDDFHGYWTALALALLTPVFALTQLPKKDEFEENYFNENAFFNFLIRYIAIPFIYVYFFILYAYSAKVLMNFSDWPKGEVSWMVIGFSLFGYITYMFSYIFECGNKKENHKLIILFRKYFPLVVIPQIAMLFYAIGLRIGQYDLTMNRYFVVVFGIWLLVSSVYLIVSQKKSLLYIPTLLTLFSIIISIWPWSVYHLPLTRQTERLKDNLIEANILQDGKIVPLEKYSDISQDLSNQIYDGIDYICDFKSCENVKELFPEIYQKIYDQEKQQHEQNKENYPNDTWRQTEYSGPSTWTLVSKIAEEIKVRQIYGWSRESSQTIYIYNRDSLYPLDVNWYDTLIEINMSSYDDDENLNAIVNIKDETIKIQSETLSETINISTVFESLRDDTVGNNADLNKEERTFEISWELFEGKLFINSATIPNEAWSYDEDNYNYINGFLLFKAK